MKKEGTIVAVALILALLIGPALSVFADSVLADVADGVYVGEAMGYYDFIEVEVTVAGGAFKDIKILFCDDSDGIWQIASRTLIQRMLEKQTYEVDVVSTATRTSTGIINAVKAAISGGDGW